ncbi:MAG: hypothetical protein U9Q67_02200 [Patescibacteria group bacterium]|nr:hypothetical protein [Patescibacteria group bacterium]
MKKQWGLTRKILNGEKTIETRWYKARYAPWNRIRKGDTVYFKDTGETVTVKARVKKVEQYNNLDAQKIQNILKKYGHADLGTIGIEDAVLEYVNGKKYCVAIYLEKPQAIERFEIDKSGYGMMSAWLCVDDINEIKI